MVRRLLRRLAVGVSLLALGLWLAFLRPAILGGTTGYTIVSGVSMQPVFEAGDLVVSQAQPQYGPGDIVVYRVPGGQAFSGRLIVHRIVGGDATEGFVLRGDNSNSQDPWLVPAADVVGRVMLHVPAGGRAVLLIRSPFIVGSAAAGIAFVLIAFPANAGRRRDGDEGRGVRGRGALPA